MCQSEQGERERKQPDEKFRPVGRAADVLSWSAAAAPCYMRRWAWHVRYLYEVLFKSFLD